MSSLWEQCKTTMKQKHMRPSPKIRKKIRKNTQEEYIEAIWGIGYKIKK